MQISTKQPKPTSRIQYQKQAEQEVVTGNGGIHPTTNHQCLYKTLRTINEGVSRSYVSVPDKTVPFRTISQAMPTSQQATNKTPTTRGRTNG